MKRLALTTLAVLALTAMLLPSAQGQSSYSVVDIGLLPGTTFNQPRAINNAGDVGVVGASFAKSGTQTLLGHAFYWSRTTGLMDIGTFAGIRGSAPLDVNAQGEVVGYSKETAGGDGVGVRPLYWHRSRGAGNPLALPTLGGDFGNARRINDDGTIIGTVTDASDTGYAVVWVPNAFGSYGTPAPLLPLTGDSVCNAVAINAAGEIVGYSYTDDPNANPRLCVWQPGTDGRYGLPVDLGVNGSSGFINDVTQVLGFPAGVNGAAFLWSWDTGVVPIVDEIGMGNGTMSVGSLNNGGQVAGQARNPAGYWRAFLWDSAAGMRELGTLGGSHSWAGGSGSTNRRYALNAGGQVVGYSNTSGNKALHAYVWDSQHLMRDLNDLTPSKAGFSYLETAEGINDLGVITGLGIKKGVKRTYVAIPAP